MQLRREVGPFTQTHRVIRDREPLEFAGNQTVISRGHGKCFPRQCQSRLQRPVVPFGKFSKELCIVVRVGRYRDTLEVLCRRTHHGRSADIDVFYQVFGRNTCSAGRVCEGIKIHHDHIHWRDCVLARFVGVLRPVTTK